MIENRSKRPDAGYGQQAPRALVLLRCYGKLGIEIGDPLVECGPALPHITDEPMDAAAKHWLVCVKQLGKPDGELCTALRYDVAALQKQTPNLVHQRGAVTDELVTNAMQRLHVELVLGLQLGKSHSRPGCGFRDRLGIAVVILLNFDVGADILR